MSLIINRGVMKSVGVTLGAAELHQVEQMAAAYSTNRSEIIRASIRAAYKEFEQERQPVPKQYALDFA